MPSKLEFQMKNEKYKTKKSDCGYNIKLNQQKHVRFNHNLEILKVVPQV